MAETLDSLRAQIDALDGEIQRLINQRASLAKQVAEAKQTPDGASRTAGEQSIEYYRPAREAQVLRRVMERNQGPLSAESMARLFREIMSACLALEQTLTIAYLGPAGTFTQAAALKQFGHAVTCVPLTSIDAVFREVAGGAAHFGVVPIENSTEGVIDYTLDMFLRSSLCICGEVELRVHHNLLSNATDLASIRKVYTHQQSLAQCRHWLDTHMPQVERMAVSSNAEAARRAALEPDAAAIASDIAAEIYGLMIHYKNIEDEPDNTTRFIVIGGSRVPPSGKDKTSLLMSTVNQPGSLYRLLQPFAEHNISMSRIESRPSRVSLWHYVFFVDIDGHIADENVAKAIQAVEREAAMLKVLGSYPKAVL